MIIWGWHQLLYTLVEMKLNFAYLLAGAVIMPDKQKGNGKGKLYDWLTGPQTLANHAVTMSTRVTPTPEKATLNYKRANLVRVSTWSEAKLNQVGHAQCCVRIVIDDYVVVVLLFSTGRTRSANPSAQWQRSPGAQMRHFAGSIA